MPPGGPPPPTPAPPPGPRPIPGVAGSKAPAERLCTLYVGKIPAGVDDDELRQLLQCCGSVVKWKRQVDPASGAPKAFGFCDYSTGESVLRAMRLLASLPLGEDGGTRGWSEGGGALASPQSTPRTSAVGPLRTDWRPWTTHASAARPGALAPRAGAVQLLLKVNADTQTFLTAYEPEMRAHLTWLRTSAPPACDTGEEEPGVAGGVPHPAPRPPPGCSALAPAPEGARPPSHDSFGCGVAP